MKLFFRSFCLLTGLLLQLTGHLQIVPVLNSYPSARAVIFLDFDGQAVVGTSWTSFGEPLYCDNSGLNSAQITEIFNRVAEDYRPFNINITTDSTKYFAAPLTQRTRVIFTLTSDWYPVNVGGVSFFGSFSSGEDLPCFVFSGKYYGRINRIAEAGSHEAGHTLGLYHQARYDDNCNKLEDYNIGQGSGEIGWAPIMGKGYYQNFTLWHNGPDEWGCNNYHSDLDIITSSTNGFGYRPDDHGSDFTNATQPTFSNNQFSATGVVERNTDKDMFRFIMPGKGRFQLDAVPYNVGTGNAGSDLDMQVTLYDESQSVLSVYNPGTLLNSVADTLLNSGTYYLKVEGKGNLYAPAYASLGSYSLLGNIQIGGNITLPLRRFELRGLQNGDKHQLNWLIDADEKIVGQVLEIATDGRNFITLAEANSETRSYIYRPATQAMAIYRLAVLFEDGHRYYSNTVSIREMAPATRPRLLSNLIISNTVYANSPGNYACTIMESNGRIVYKGQLTSGINELHLNHMTAGMYIVVFTGKDLQWTDKLVRQ